MCRLFAMTSEEPLSPVMAVQALDVMREGHDGSGVGLFLSDLGGPFEELKGAPILSGIFTNDGLKRLDQFMMNIGFMTKYKISIKVPKTPPPGVPRRDVYLIRAYEYPETWEGLSDSEKEHRLMMIRIQLRQMGEEKEDMIVYSFWPDVIMLKEIGDPMSVVDYLHLDREDLRGPGDPRPGAGRTPITPSTSMRAIPFFIQGVATMTNGENTAFVSPSGSTSRRGDFRATSATTRIPRCSPHILHYCLHNGWIWASRHTSTSSLLFRTMTWSGIRMGRSSSS